MHHGSHHVLLSRVVFASNLGRRQQRSWVGGMLAAPAAAPWGLEDVETRADSDPPPSESKRAREDETEDKCAFCHEGIDSDDEDDDPLVLVQAAGRSKPTYVHENCLYWCPELTQAEDLSWQNVGSALRRCHRLKCAGCGEGDAPLGCKRKACKKNWHYPCAMSAAEKDELVVYEDEYCVACPICHELLVRRKRKMEMEAERKKAERAAKKAAAKPAAAAAAAAATAAAAAAAAETSAAATTSKAAAPAKPLAKKTVTSAKANPPAGGKAPTASSSVKGKKTAAAAAPTAVAASFAAPPEPAPPPPPPAPACPDGFTPAEAAVRL